MSHYRHLDMDERRRLYQLRQSGRSVHEAATELGRHLSTIYRELKRNRHLDDEPMFRGYFPTLANDKAAARRRRGLKISRNLPLATYVVDRLEAAWSPEQIAGYLRRHRIGSGNVCHETIYQYVYSEEGKRQHLWKLLPMARKKRRSRYGRKPRAARIPEANTIAQRPPEIAERSSFGHWEGDLIAFRAVFGKANLTTLVERRSRFTILCPNPSKHSTEVITGIERRLRSLPPPLRRSITFDRGTEFARYPRLASALNIVSYFCKPSAPWQKGSVENTNGRIRRFLPFDTDIAAVSDRQLQGMVDRLNNTPRKCLGYQTPQEVLSQQLDAPLLSVPVDP
ncbi:IS30 family transposase [Sphingomonas trueperi]|uniref:IS30 family transposase n=1 Tax=Sphingomonas trueperi TaxID=53317 RepID=UPI000EAD42DF